MRRKVTTPEGAVLKQIRAYLEAAGCVVIRFDNGGRTIGMGRRVPSGNKGVSDLIVCTPRGRFAAVEVKAPGGKPTVDQERFLEDVRNRGGIGIVAYDLEAVRVTITGAA